MICINKQDIKKILEIMEEFPNAWDHKLEVNNASCIGSILKLTMNMNINNRNFIATIEITDTSNW